MTPVATATNKPTQKTNGRRFFSIKRLQHCLLSLDLGVVDLGGTAETTGASGGNQTDLLTVRGISADGRRVTNVLMVTTSVGMVDRVHRHTTNVRPAVSLGLVLVERVTGLQHRLVDTATSGNDADHSASAGRDRLLGTGRQTDASLALIRVVRDDGGVVSGRARERAAVANLRLNVADDSTLGHRSDGEHIANVQGSLLAAVHELTGVHALSGDEHLAVDLVLVGITEINTGEGSATAGVVDDFFDNTLDVSVSLSEVDAAVLGSTLSVVGVRLEDATGTLSLCCKEHTSTSIAKHRKDPKFWIIYIAIRSNSH